ncbi:MAG: hypothetical protein HJJLKODD_02097 [Phycisphaerae bacterium]|nr:hypothetical protein [Phycisphaerae bacterium]
MVGLMLLIIPLLRGQVQSARAVRCQEHLSLIYRGLLLYKDNNDGWWPEQRMTTQAGWVRDQNNWIELVADNQYVGSVASFTCPSDPTAPSLQSNLTRDFLRYQISHAPSFGLNQLTWREYGVPLALDPGERRQPSRKSNTILLADLGPDLLRSELPENELDRWERLREVRDAGRLVADDGFRIGQVFPTRTWLTPRHHGAINLLAMGGHIQATHQTSNMVIRWPEKYYDDCATGDCTFCNVFRAPHYDFSASALYWWSGPYYSTTTAPVEPTW